MTQAPLGILPRVSVIMPVLNEERHLREAVLQILNQDYQGEIEVVMAVGPSRDATQQVADALAAEFTSVHVVQNPSGKTPAALNAAIARAAGDVVVRVDGHALIPHDYVANGVQVLNATGADNVGGIMDAKGSTPFESAVARAMTSRFGVGGAAFHIGGEPGPALTVYLGCFRADALARVGGYDETMERAQDWEMNLRIRQTGGVVWFTPQMRVEYRPRANTLALARQYHDYGRWRREVARRHPETLSLRYLAAPIAVVLVALGLIVGVIGLASGMTWLALAGFAMPLGYLLANLLASLISALGKPRLGLRGTAALPLVYATMHAAWGLGFLRGAA
ncbi:MAG: glycosyltransferase family 2 protein [Actinomycetota bacterium]|nr:glycosyltransferase family 2 protein [Actinomycetota bacterium]MDP2289185.1 glycosyltransferase family 2 protein [Actinomycetota bacterium]